MPKDPHWWHRGPRLFSHPSLDRALPSTGGLESEAECARYAAGSHVPHGTLVASMLAKRRRDVIETADYPEGTVRMPVEFALALVAKASQPTMLPSTPTFL